jgi:hypothetical protein
MKKIAVFVEGQTEQIFVDKLIREIFDKRKITIKQTKIEGKQIIIIKNEVITQNTVYYFQIYDCHGGGENSTVISDIKEQLSSLLGAGFCNIIGIRDVYPSKLDAVSLKGKLLKIISNANPVSIILANREIEAWFIAEDRHYEKISPLLTMGIVNTEVGIDIQKDSTETIPRPSAILHNIYHKANFAYHKSKNQVERTVRAIDYENLYLNVRNRNSSLAELLTCLDDIIC